MKVRDNVMAERMFGCCEFHEKPPRVNWQRLRVKRYEADHFPHMFRPWVHPFLSVQNTFSDQTVMSVVIKGQVFFTTSLHETGASEQLQGQMLWRHCVALERPRARERLGSNIDIRLRPMEARCLPAWASDSNIS